MNYPKKRKLRNNRPVYVFDITNELIAEFDTTNELLYSKFAERWLSNGENSPRISNSQCQHCVSAKLFFTYDRNFKVSYRASKENHNPLRDNKSPNQRYDYHNSHIVLLSAPVMVREWKDCYNHKIYEWIDHVYTLVFDPELVIRREFYMDGDAFKYSTIEIAAERLHEYFLADNYNFLIPTFEDAFSDPQEIEYYDRRFFKTIKLK